MELVGRLEKVTAKPAGPGGIVRAKKRDLIEAAACIREMVESLEDARTNVRAFAAPWAVTFARERVYPDGALHFAHYDILAKAGARMTGFTRYVPPAPGAEDE
ncbi:hypothetical protein [Brevundimonas diminuta]|uniref:hypothetical protein n=1 Tax=Brevundimonas diminuta TaxID=293 RepID=UPI0030FB7966